MTIKYDEVNQEMLQRSYENDDSIGQALNLFAIFLNSNEYQPFDELPEVKNILNQAFNDYNVLLKSIHINNDHNFRTKKTYEFLTDKNRDNLSG